jgi:hypothetical protein
MNREQTKKIGNSFCGMHTRELHPPDLRPRGGGLVYLPQRSVREWMGSLLGPGLPTSGHSRSPKKVGRLINNNFRNYHYVAQTPVIFWLCFNIFIRCLLLNAYVVNCSWKRALFVLFLLAWKVVKIILLFLVSFAVLLTILQSLFKTFHPNFPPAGSTDLVEAPLWRHTVEDREDPLQILGRRLFAFSAYLKGGRGGGGDSVFRSLFKKLIYLVNIRYHHKQVIE